MNNDLRALLDGLYAAGRAHDADEPDRLLRLRNLEPETAALLAADGRFVTTTVPVGKGLQLAWRRA